VFSLAKLRKFKEEGAYFALALDGRKIFIGPEESMQINPNLGSSITPWQFDECVANPAEYEYAKTSVNVPYAGWNAAKLSLTG
jgi:queuine tRNA-ribosyltransferase